MKIAFIDQSGQLGGAELMLLDLIPHLMAEAFVVTFNEGPFPAALREHGIEVKVVDFKKHSGGEVTKRAGFLAALKVLPGVWRMAKEVANEVRGADVIYANTPKAWIIGALISKKLRIPMVCHLHDIISVGHFSRLNRFLLVQAANRAATAVIANSEASATAFIQAGGKSALLTVIPNGFDLQQFVSTPSVSQKSLRKTLDIRVAPMAVLAGRLAPWKGQHIFIEAVSKHFDIHGIIVGEALFTEEDRRYASELPLLAVKHGCSDRIHFLGFRKDMREIFHEADVIVHCSVTAEPFGRVIVEAMLCGRPVIAANEGGPSEIIEHGVTGLLYPPGNVEMLTVCFNQLLDDREGAEELALRGQIAAQKRYDLLEIASATKAVLSRTMPNHEKEVVA